MNLNANDQSQRLKWSVSSWNRMAFVTATIPETENDPSIILSRWSSFSDRLRKTYPGLRIVRVLQRHEGGHGWHVHALFDRFVPSGLMLHFASLAGLGRLDFRMVSRSSRERVISYVCRYLTRDLRKRDAVPRGCRLLAAAGNVGRNWWVRVRDCRVESDWLRLCSSLKLVLQKHGFSIPVRGFASLTYIFWQLSPAALSDWKSLNPGLVY